MTRIVESEETSRQPASQLQKTKDMERYAVERIVRHVIKKTGPHYVVHSYRYNGKNDTVKPPETFAKESCGLLLAPEAKCSPPPLNGAGMMETALKGNSQQNQITGAAP